jgi:signal transduction histidine kinase
LHIKTHIVRTLSLKVQFFAALFVWLAALIGFCYYIVRRLSQPLSHFIEGANRFARDINAPPLSEIGPKSSRRAFQAFNRMQTNLKQLIQSRTQMLAAISHDLRTPITRLKLRLENLPASETINKMEMDLDRMEAMIQSILTFAQDEYQHEPVANLDLNALCESICDDMQDTGMPVSFETSNEKFICLGRTLALRRALTNLITNGIKYGESVDVTITTQDSQAKISINDRGPGIPENELEQVFLPFYRIDKARQENTGGSGLGLATARDIIRSHGGEIELRNLSEGGLSAIVRLPVI